MVREESIIEFIETAFHNLALPSRLTKKRSLESEWDIKFDENSDGASVDWNPLDPNPDRIVGVCIIDNPIKIPFFLVFEP